MGTTMTTPTDQADAEPLDLAKRPNRALIVAVFVLAAVVLGLGAWVVYDQTSSSQTAVNEEIQALLDDYLATWNNQDGEAFLELVTDSYTLHMAGGEVSISQQAEEARLTLEDLEGRDWREVVIGEPIMTGRGPWFVSLVEHFTAPGYGPEGADGISTFTIVDDGGTLKVARHAYVGNN
jgi:hypothetical protein